MGGLALPDERALGDQGAADPAVDGRTNAGVAEIERGARDVRLAGGDVGLRLPPRRDRRLVLDLRGGPAGQQLPHAPRLLLGLLVHRLRLGQRRLRGLELHFERLRIHPVQHLARLHVGALPERAFDHDARDARTHLGDAHGRNAAGQLVHIGARRRLQRDDADARRSLLRRRDDGRLGFAAGRESKRGQEGRRQPNPVCLTLHSSSPPALESSRKLTHLRPASRGNLAAVSLTPRVASALARNRPGRCGAPNF